MAEKKPETTQKPMPAEQVETKPKDLTGRKITLDEILNSAETNGVLDHPFQFDYTNKRIVIIPRIRGYTVYFVKSTGQTTPALQVDSFKMTTGASANYVLTSDADGDASWQPTGGISSIGSLILTATGTINSVNTAFTYASKPVVIINDGLMLRENNGWTWNAGTLTATMTLPPTTDTFGLS